MSVIERIQDAWAVLVGKRLALHPSVLRLLEQANKDLKAHEDMKEPLLFENILLKASEAGLMESQANLLVIIKKIQDHAGTLAGSSGYHKDSHTRMYLAASRTLELMSEGSDEGPTAEELLTQAVAENPIQRLLGEPKGPQMNKTPMDDWIILCRGKDPNDMSGIRMTSMAEEKAFFEEHGREMTDADVAGTPMAEEEVLRQSMHPVKPLEVWVLSGHSIVVPDGYPTMLEITEKIDEKSWGIKALKPPTKPAEGKKIVALTERMLRIHYHCIGSNHPKDNAEKS